MWVQREAPPVHMVVESFQEEVLNQGHNTLDNWDLLTMKIRLLISTFPGSHMADNWGTMRGQGSA